MRAFCSSYVPRDSDNRCPFASPSHRPDVHIFEKSHSAFAWLIGVFKYCGITKRRFTNQFTNIPSPIPFHSVPHLPPLPRCTCVILRRRSHQSAGSAGGSPSPVAACTRHVSAAGLSCPYLAVGWTRVYTTHRVFPPYFVAYIGGISFFSEAIRRHEPFYLCTCTNLTGAAFVC